MRKIGSRVDVLLSTYNGESYLRQQLNSIISQNYENWHLYVRDDGSIDGTVSIVTEYLNKFPGKITLIESSEGNLGPAQSFSKLIVASSAPYIAFCDQDDIWEPEKLTLQVGVMSEAEKKYSENCAILIHTDAGVIDQKGKKLANSLWGYQKLNPGKMLSVNRLLIQNCVTGSTMLVNRKLVQMSYPIGSDAVMHDWWIALIAILKGKIISIGTPTLGYRQHDLNVIGASKWNIFTAIKLAGIGANALREKLMKTRNQARSILDLGLLSEQEALVVKRYVDLYGLSWIRKRVLLLQYGYLKYGFIRNCAVLLII